MKKLQTLLTITLLGLALPVGSVAAPKKPADAAAAATPAPKPAEAPKAAAEKVVGQPKAIPMYSRADAIDTKAKTFSNTRKDGVVVKHVITDATTINNGEAAAKLSDIKVGDYVSGSRIKKSDTEYEVVKITKFGPKAEKKPKAEGEAKPEPTKAN